MDEEAWRARVHWVTKQSDTTATKQQQRAAVCKLGYTLEFRELKDPDVQAMLQIS